MKYFCLSAIQDYVKTLLPGREDDKAAVSVRAWRKEPGMKEWLQVCIMVYLLSLLSHCIFSTPNLADPGIGA